eukprot:15062954-Alexandrium_andersonii.AAC.1
MNRGAADVELCGQRLHDLCTRVERSGARPKAVEVFCGSAGLSKSLSKAGFDVAAVDWKGNQHLPSVATRLVDLTSEAG